MSLTMRPSGLKLEAWQSCDALFSLAHIDLCGDEQPFTGEAIEVTISTAADANPLLILEGTIADDGMSFSFHIPRASLPAGNLVFGVVELDAGFRKPVATGQLEVARW
ncbi:hypothetical protein FHS85_001955 [Rhodoligotrophos appendicifer]|uniref:hypothetical protein n=1 Tax=Rhodoligotrophos appendicifer TaxID=987056 RepID=UPI001186BEFE|nr:hypothetical protein [Rhodoligotrophos appendicifer]